MAYVVNYTVEKTIFIYNVSIVAYVHNNIIEFYNL